MLPVGLTVMIRSQVLNPDLETAILCSPGASWIVEGVVPINLSSPVISPPSGTDFIVTADVADAGSLSGTLELGLELAVAANRDWSSGVSPATYAVISVPF